MDWGNMPESKTDFRPILRRGGAGFLLLTALCWVVELLQVPHFIFGEAAQFNWARVLFRTVVVLGIWAWFHFSTKRLLARLHRLEEFLLVCSWCRKLGYKGDWLIMEDFFGSKYDAKTSHGICPECSNEQFRDFDLTLDGLEPATAGEANSLPNGVLPHTGNPPAQQL